MIKVTMTMEVPRIASQIRIMSGPPPKMVCRMVWDSTGTGPHRSCGALLRQGSGGSQEQRGRDEAYCRHRCIFSLIKSRIKERRLAFP